MGEGGRRDCSGKKCCSWKPGWERGDSGCRDTGQECSAQEGVNNKGILSGNSPAQGKEKTEAKKGRNFTSWGSKYSLIVVNQEQLYYMAPSKYFQSGM